jgi:hypothetical protein
MNTYIVHADSKVSKALIAIFKALNVSFEVVKKTEKDTSFSELADQNPYDPEFVKMVLKSRKSNNRRVLDDAYKKELFGQK